MLVRRGERVYRYTHRREGDKVLKVYAGSGEAALEAGRREEEERHRRREEAEEARRRQRQAEEALVPLEAFSRLLDVATGAVLTRLGFRLHARGEWRLRKHEGGQEGLPGG